MITVTDYFMGRRETHPLDLSPAIERNAALTVEIANHLLALAEAAGIKVPAKPATGSQVASGWRPPDVNAATKGAATNSKHMTGQAVDLYDPDGRLDAWLMSEAGQAALVELGLWLEHPSSTPGWAHVQTIPPGSGHRVFYP